MRIALGLIVVGPGTPPDERRALQRGALRGAFVRIRRGVYLPAAEWVEADERARGLIRLAALQAVSRERIVFSHWSAALALGLPVPFDRMVVPHRLAAGGVVPSQPDVRTHRTAVLGDPVETDGLLVTPVARTAVDIAALEGLDLGVMVADAALRMLGLERDEGAHHLQDAWSLLGLSRGGRRVEATVALVDPLAETPIESRSRVTMHRLGLAAPVLQQRFDDRHGFVARTDFWFPHAHVVGEADGRLKYLDERCTRGDPAGVVSAEKQREDRLRALVSGVARWGWRAAVDPSRLGPILASAGVLPER